jgi:excisionase family DNA binding protein
MYNKFEDVFCIIEVRIMKNNMEDKWINTDEAAEYLGVKATTIREWIKKNNGIPAYKIGRCWRFKKTELDKWVNSEK